jgi:hypothetical protein
MTTGCKPIHLREARKGIISLIAKASLTSRRLSVILLLDGSPRSGELTGSYFVGFPARISGESHIVPLRPPRPLREASSFFLTPASLHARKASGNDAALFEAEIVASARSGRTDDDVIYQLELQDSAGLENSPVSRRSASEGEGSPDG